MDTFKLYGELPNSGDVASEGHILVTPSILPLYKSSGELIAYEPLSAPIIDNEFEIHLPANIATVSFVLWVVMKLNSGVTYTFPLAPKAVGVEQQFNFTLATAPSI